MRQHLSADKRRFFFYNGQVPKLRLDQYVSLVLVCVALFFAQPAQVTHSIPVTATPSLVLVDAAAIPTYVPEGTASAAVQQNLFSATISAQAMYAMDVPTASVLLNKNASAVRSPASTTKLLTALVVRDAYPLDTFLTVGDESTTAGTVVGLQPGEKLPVRNLLSAMLIPSGNDAAKVLADNYPGGYPAFIVAMNAKAKQLHLDHSQFKNPAGIDEEGHHSTARDLAILAREVMKDDLLAEIVGTKTEVITDNSNQFSHLLTNTNELLGSDLGVIGIKTGTTDEAGEVLITEFKHDHQDVLVVVMGSQDRYADTVQVIRWIKSHYIWVDPNSGTLNKPAS